MFNLEWFMIQSFEAVTVDYLKHFHSVLYSLTHPAAYFWSPISIHIFLFA